MAVEVVYLWRAVPFCGDVVRLQLLEVLQDPLPQRHSPSTTHLVLNSMQRFAEAEKVIIQCVGVRDVWEVWVWMYYEATKYLKLSLGQDEQS